MFFGVNQFRKSSRVILLEEAVSTGIEIASWYGRLLCKRLGVDPKKKVRGRRKVGL